jgi:hypothetical protein
MSEGKSIREPRLVDLKRASAEWGIPIWTLRRLVWNGDLATVKLPSLDGRDKTARRIWIAREDLDRLIEQSKTIAS